MNESALWSGIRRVHAFRTRIVSGVQVGAGRHSAQPLYHRRGLDAVTRVGVCRYSTRKEIGRLIQVVVQAQHLLGACI
ncbi:MAG: aminotransferase class V-fold PLP-dependent enzyme [Chloroflexi bacterium]|nr:aminotransferase class V-fold PLP-dependent enzyme [Chloroflexota bacterium]